MSSWWDLNIVSIQTTFLTLLIALSVALPMRMGVFSVAGVGAYGVGAYVTAIAILKFSWGTWPALFLGTVVAGVITYILGLILNRLGGLYLAMSTMAFVLIVVVVTQNGGDWTGGSVGLFGVIGEISMPQIIAITVVITALLALSERGRIGRRTQAVHDDPLLASSMGIKVARYRQLSFLISGLVAGIAGGIEVLLRTVVTPEVIGFNRIILALTIIIVGGAGSWIGVVLGTIIFIWLPQVLTFVGEYEAIVYGILVAIAAIYLPGGVTGETAKLYRKWQARRQHQADIALAPIQSFEGLLSQTQGGDVR
jgi:branched-chain amino acid transport system permease protein